MKLVLVGAGTHCPSGVRECSMRCYVLAINDTLTLKVSKIVQGSQIHYQRVDKPTMERFMRGQYLVEFGAGHTTISLAFSSSIEKVRYMTNIVLSSVAD